MNLLNDHYNAPVIIYPSSPNNLLIIESEDECIVLSKEFTGVFTYLIRHCDITTYKQDSLFGLFGFQAGRKNIPVVETELRTNGFCFAHVPTVTRRYRYCVDSKYSESVSQFITLIHHKLSNINITHNAFAYQNNLDRISIDIEKQYALSLEFKVVTDYINQDVYIFYKDEPCLIIADTFYRIFTVVDKLYNELKLYKSFDVKVAFATLIVKILNNR